MKFISLDLTPWLRGPLTGVGLSALKSAEALRDELYKSKEFDLHYLSRDLRGTLGPNGLGRLKYLNPIRRFRGHPDEIFHSFQLHLPQVKRSKKVLSLHDCWTLWPNEFQDSAFQSTQRKRLSSAIKRADRIVTPTKAVAERLRDYDPSLAERTSVVHWGSVLAPPEAKPSAKPILPDSLREYLAKKRPFVLVVGSLEVRKNHGWILEAMTSLKGYDLVLAGKPGFGAEKILNGVESLSRIITVLNYRDLGEAALSALYDEAQVFVSASLDEGFGLPVLEAMTRHRPVLLSSIAAHKEIAGDAALYFEGPEQLRELLNSLREDPSRIRLLEEQSRKRSLLFSWAKTAKELVAIYKGL